MIISIRVLCESAFLQRNQELRSIKDRSPTENYRAGAGPIHPSPVLLSGNTELALRVMNIVFNIVRQHRKFASERLIWCCLAASNDEIHDSLKIMKIHHHDDELCWVTASREMKLQTCRAQNIKLHNNNFGALLLVGLSSLHVVFPDES